MSDKRTVEDIQKDFNNLAFKAGHLQFQIDCNTGDLNKINQTLKDLNLEFVAAKNAEAKAAETEKVSAV